MQIRVLLAAALAIAIAVPASAATVNFVRASSNGTNDAAPQLSVDVTNGSGGALFDFKVAAGTPNPKATVTGIYFSDPALFAPLPVIDTASSGVKFAQPGLAPPAFPFFSPVTSALTLGATQPPAANGLSAGETLIVKLAYATDKGFGDLLAALRAGSFKIGLRLQRLAGCETKNGVETCGDDLASDQFVSVPIPLPMSAWLALTAFGGLLVAARRRRRLAVA